jgi:hypothetical protein
MNYINSFLVYLNLRPIIDTLVPISPEMIDDCRISYSASRILELNGRKVQIDNFTFENILENCQDDDERKIVLNCKSLINRHSEEIMNFKSVFLHNSTEGLIQFIKPNYNMDNNDSFCVKIDQGIENLRKVINPEKLEKA